MFMVKVYREVKEPNVVQFHTNSPGRICYASLSCTSENHIVESTPHETLSSPNTLLKQGQQEQVHQGFI